MRQLWLPTTLNQPMAYPLINRFDAIISALMGFAPKNGYVRPRGEGILYNQPLKHHDFSRTQLQLFDFLVMLFYTPLTCCCFFFFSNISSTSSSIFLFVSHRVDFIMVITARS